MAKNEVAAGRERNAMPALDCDAAASGARVRVLLIRTNEDWEIAREWLPHSTRCAR